MESLYSLAETRILLRRMVASGYVTIDQLDTPSPSWQANAKTFRLHFPRYPQPEYVNLLRSPELGETVQPSDPRDFTPASGPTPAVAPPLPITLEVNDPPFSEDNLPF